MSSSGNNMAAFQASARGRTRNFVGTDATKMVLHQQRKGALTERTDHSWKRLTESQEVSDLQEAREIVRSAINGAVQEYNLRGGGASSGSSSQHQNHHLRQQQSKGAPSSRKGSNASSTNVPEGLPVISMDDSAFEELTRKSERGVPGPGVGAATTYSERCFLPQELSKTSSTSTQFVGQGSARRPNKAGPAPGQYIWKDDVNLHKPACWSLQSTDRSKLNPRVAAWVTESTSGGQCPPPGAYGDVSKIQPRGGAIVTKTPTIGGVGQREAPKAHSEDLMYRLPPLLGTWRHPTIQVAQGFSVQSCERQYLSFREDSWLPLQRSNNTPGPGEYSQHRWLEGKQKGFHNPKKGPAFGVRIDNLSRLLPSWIPETYSQRHFKSLC
mmetsp:Transcript_27721/g.69930  ORF Transcript_27721/g.69930 Transcript_27721/m.69930 type:complete len:383 (-) Transcript_27721:257-1405(-)